jgi:hypothetical protein
MTNGYQLLEATDGNTQGDVSPLISTTRSTGTGCQVTPGQ